MRSSHLILGVLVLLLAGAAGVYVASRSTEPSPDAGAPTQARPEGASRNAHPTVLGNAPFLTAHERGRAFTPDGENLAPSFHVEMEALRRGLEAAPDDTTKLIRMARLLQDGHQTEAAVDYYRRYLALHPEGRKAWLDLAQSYGTLARWDEALEATEELLRRSPDDPAALYNLGAIYANTDRLEEARAAWQRVVDQDRDASLRVMAEGALQRLRAMHP